ncbi:hypothetical protein [Alicyclobacillus sp. SO9]|uniref:hypothetical protein n=1 Tax=Alicyclobacillus sp. SO9 TaxID=2665646 RepID=UPI0018E72639|nr:hypothetical protein [Alicyclobacillus sp. SO9]QQE78621.1 hypothetical protein GI364_22635 [Alicyclobacillus sp. SO9]
MIKQFWQTMTALAVLVTAVSGLSLMYLGLSNMSLTPATSYSEWTNLPVTFPSIWNILRPAASAGWLVTIVVLVLQILLTGGFYGTLIRTNTGQAASVNTFMSDALRSFGRLLTWNILWAAIFLLIAAVARSLPQAALLLTILAIIVRFVFLFAETALVGEGRVPMANALRTAAVTLLGRMMQMIPFGVIVIVLSGLAEKLFASFPLLRIPTVLAYALAMTWILHMIVARYIYYSNYQSSPISRD